MFVISKSSQDFPFPYSGIECDRAGVPHGKIYTSRIEAIKDANKLNAEFPEFKVWGAQDEECDKLSKIFFSEIGAIAEVESRCLSEEDIIAADDFFRLSFAQSRDQNIKNLAKKFIDRLLGYTW